MRKIGLALEVKALREIPGPAKQVATKLRAGLLEIIGEDVAAIWLYGASVFGPNFVDVDLHVLLRRHLTKDEGDEIGALHRSIESQVPGVQDIDCWYILLDDARRSEPPANVAPWNPGLRDTHWPLHRAHWLAGACVVVHGAAPSDVVRSPAWDEIERSLREEADEAARHLDTGSAYWTLQLCRVLASLETRHVVRSKVDSGEWALDRLPEKTHPIVHAAVRFYCGAPEAGDHELIRQCVPDFYATVRPLIDAALTPRP